ncbi:3-ketoacyl-CoA thiolase [Seinonella peptonophila]|uniref:acetyl-CoA C-acyltransferase n=1 Tax=Seinonella peptonophila TaxID=112248 RepID=A0A1M4Z3Q5_9BACL|nr:acetyl-CoA C-acyltransferase [Seinonella peptonophila]SHF12578.1 3-ketoacyl-CoA thiolase [Seinonella peptonophila]
MKEAVIVAGCRTAVGKAKKGAFRHTRPDELGAAVIQDLLTRVPQVEPHMIDDLVIGCAFPEGEQGMNVARIMGLRSGLPTTVPGITVNRYCSSGLQSIAMAAERIMCGFADVIIAGGVESMSMIPMGGFRIAPNPHLMDHYPQVYMSMGHTAEEVAKRYQISRADQDHFAVESHRRATQALEQKRFEVEITPIHVKEKYFDSSGKVQEKESIVQVDEGVRSDTNWERLSQLPPAFRVDGTVTAGNTSQTSDGAAAVMIMSAERAKSLGCNPIAKFRGFMTGGVDPEVMGIGPVAAIPKLLSYTGLTLDQIDLIELNEAFAAQTLAIMRELNLDEQKVNVNGGAIALGHPLGCTGTKLTVSLLNELQRRSQRYGIVTMCIGGGMGAAGLFEMMS